MFKIGNEIVIIPQKNIALKLKANIPLDMIKDEIELIPVPEKDSHTIFSQKKLNLFPTTIWIMPTDQCNLRCRYCYSGAGCSENGLLTKQQVKTFINKAAISAYLLKKAARLYELEDELSSPVLNIWFAGGGEPTFSWDIFTYSIELAKQYAKEYGFSVHFGLLTNGMIEDSNKIDYIANNINHIQVSIDGTEDEQNTHRPAINNAESFPTVDYFIKNAKKGNSSISLRSTVSSYNVNKLGEITEFFCTEYPYISSIMFEPVEKTELSVYNNIHEPNLLDFCTNIKIAMQIAKKYFKPVITSLLKISKYANYDFCGAMDNTSIVLNPMGHLTKCPQVSSSTSDSPFVVGKISEDGLIYSNNSTNEVIAKDNKCNCCPYEAFCHGECPMIRTRDLEGHNYRCAIRKLLTNDFFWNMVNETGKYLMNSKKLNYSSPHIEKVFNWDEDVMGYKWVNIE